MYSMEESWDFENQESISPMQELKQKYAERLDEIEHHSPKSKRFETAITKEANELECQNVERRQELVIQLRRREQQLKQLKQTLKVKNKPKPPSLLLKSPRSRSKQSDMQEIDDLLAGFQAMRNYLQSKYGWQFSKQQVDVTHTEESYEDYDLLRSNKIKFDLLENKIYHLDLSAQQEYDVQRYQKRHKNGLLDSSVRSYQSLATSAKKEVLSLRFDKTSTRLPVIPSPKEPVVQQSAQQVSTFRGILASTSKRLPYFSPSQMLQSPKIKPPQYGYMGEDIVANSVSSRVLTRKQTTFNLSEGESQRKHRLKDQSVNMSQERRIKNYYADANFDVIREVPRKKKKEKRLERGEALKQMVAKVVQRSRTILHRLEGKEKKPSPEHSFLKIKEAQKKFLSEASTLSKANKLQLEERLGEISEVFFKVQKREQSKLFDYYKKQFKK